LVSATMEGIKGDQDYCWTCPDCGKLLCEDGFTSLERKIEVHKGDQHARTGDSNHKG
jgi:hypothetical protein